MREPYRSREKILGSEMSDAPLADILDVKHANADNYWLLAGQDG